MQGEKRTKMKLSEIIEVFIAGDWGNESQTKDTPYAVSCVRGADIVPIQNNEFRDIPLRYISLRSFENKLLQEGDIVVEKSGGSPTQATGRAVYISKELLSATRSMVCSNFCIAFRVKQGWNPYFVYQYWQHLYNRGIFFNFEGKTSGIKNLQLDIVLSTIEIEPYSVEEQNTIAKQLQLIEQKIGLNRAINHNLEAMAKQLYDYWFVQFDFPDKDGKPYKSSGGEMVWNEKLKREVPEGWFVSNICRIADILSGGTPQKVVSEYWENGVIPFFGPTDYRGDIFQAETIDHITQNGLNHCASSLFEEGTIIITARGSIGKLVILGKPMAMNQSCYALQSKRGEYEYLYFLTIQLIEYLKTKGSGSVFKSIIASDIENSFLCIANAETITRFCTTTNPLLQRIKQSTLEISELTKQRDKLLPLLMNGQVKVGVECSRLNYDLSHD